MARTCVLTGSASGIGAATRSWLEREGCRVVGVDLRDADVVADLATREGRREMLRRAGELSGGAVDAVVACAGVGSIADPETIVRLNFFGAEATLAGLRPLLVRGQSPRAAAVSSTAVLFEADPDILAACDAMDEERAAALARERGHGQRAYSAAKRALARWVRRMSVSPEWAGAGIPLNAVGPGVIRTAMTRERLDDPAHREAMRGPLPMPLRWPGEPEDVASLLGYLVSPANTLVTGQLVFVDGGFDVVTRGQDVW